MRALITGGAGFIGSHLAEALLEHETLDAIQIRRVVAGLPLDDSPSSSDNDGGAPQRVKDGFKNPILPPITGNNPATA